MPALIKTGHTGRIKWLGVNRKREKTLLNEPVSEMRLGFDGCAEESRAGLTRPSCSRVVSQYQRGTEIRNTRQLSIVSTEDLVRIAEIMEINRLDPAWISASVVVEGIPDFSSVPPSSRLQASGGTTLTIDVQNRPCHLPAKVIDRFLPEKGRLFKNAAKGLRGVTAWVEREGILRVGDDIFLHIPDQPIWPHLASARQK